MNSRILILIMVMIFLFSAFINSALAEDENEEKTDDPAEGDRDDTPEDAESLPDEPDETISEVPLLPVKEHFSSPHWMNAFWSSGLGFAGGNLNLKYRNVPRGLEDEFEASADGFGDSHQVSFWFFPTKGRGFLVAIGLGGGSSNGHFFTDESDSEFLDGKEYWTSTLYTPIGLGYRWLVGSADRVSINLRGDAIWMTQGLHLEGTDDTVSLNGFGPGLHFSTHYRYDNGFLLGGAAEFRVANLKHTDTQILDALVDVKYDTSSLTFNILIGWEPRYVYKVAQ